MYMSKQMKRIIHMQLSFDRVAAKGLLRLQLGSHPIRRVGDICDINQ